MRLREALLDIQTGRAADTHGWMHQLAPPDGLTRSAAASERSPAPGRATAWGRTPPGAPGGPHGERPAS